jgi:imidazoleglycerol phosphate synthase glutamine amidotransferase subunit HisH
MIVIVDYGLGNLASVANMFKKKLALKTFAFLLMKWLLQSY